MTNIERYEAAPGSYNLSQDLTTRSQVYLNPPRPTIPRGKKQPNIYYSFAHSKELMGLDAPSVSKYSPNASMLFKSSSVSKFGNEQRKDHFLMASDRSPGPIYMYTERNKRTCSFGTGEKLVVKESDDPSPAAYNPKVIKNQLPIKMKGYISDKMYLKNLESTYKGKIGPGPACYSPSESPPKGMKLPQSIRLKPIINENPGPGSYSTLPHKLNLKSHGFGGSKRSLDIRACILYLDGNSIELFR